MTTEEYIANTIINDEYATSKTNQENSNLEFEAVLDMLELVRSEKNYDWLSNIFYPEVPSILLTDASNWASQYFKSRDFVDVYLEGDKPNDSSNTKAVKKLINKSLNNKNVYYFQKYMRMRLINALAGCVYLKCWWERDYKNELIGYEEKELDVDVFGNKIVDRMTQTPVFEKFPKYEQKIIVDRFNFDVIDPRNVFTNNKYVYSIQEKDWIIIRSEMSYNELKDNAKRNGYFNLDKLLEQEKSKKLVETETSKESYNKDDNYKPITAQTSIKYFDVYERFGKFWAVVKRNDKTGRVIKTDYGVDENGFPFKNAELIETIITIAVCNNTNYLIRFQATPFVDVNNVPFKPIIRGLCYVHPTKDTGMSSGKYLRELQIALNDTINMSQNRVTLATLPTLKANRYSMFDNDSIYFEPEHVMLVEHPDDITEFKISDNIDAALRQISMLKGGMQQLESVYPNTMGQLPDDSSVTATAIAGAESRGNIRTNYKSLTFEYTCLVELYNMLVQMAARFMHPNTAIEIMSEDATNFNPKNDYTYVPVSSNIETEHNKFQKIRMIDQLIGRLVNLQNPKTPILLNRLLALVFEALGQEYQEFNKVLLDEQTSTTVSAQPQTPKDINTMPVSNQRGILQSPQEETVRAESM